MNKVEISGENKDKEEVKQKNTTSVTIKKKMPIIKI